MKKNNQPSKYKVFITPVVLFAVFALGIIFILNPTLKSLDDDANAVQEKLVELDIEKDKIGELPIIKEKFVKVDTHKNDLDVLFHEDEIVSLVQEIEKIAEETNNIIAISVDEDEIVVKNLKNKKTKDNEEDDELLDGFSEDEYFKINIDVDGSYEGLLNFIDKFSRLKYYNSLVSFNIKSLEEEKKDKNKLIDTDTDDTEEPKDELSLESKLSIVFYLNKIVNNSDNKNGS